MVDICSVVPASVLALIDWLSVSDKTSNDTVVAAGLLICMALLRVSSDVTIRVTVEYAKEVMLADEVCVHSVLDVTSVVCVNKTDRNDSET